MSARDARYAGDERVLIEQLADAWSARILMVLCDGPRRFNDIRRRLGTVTQRTLALSLRRLERNGIVARSVLDTSPIAVEYAITPLGRSTKDAFDAVRRWASDHRAEVESARRAYDARYGE